MSTQLVPGRAGRSRNPFYGAYMRELVFADFNCTADFVTTIACADGEPRDSCRWGGGRVIPDPVFTTEDTGSLIGKKLDLARIADEAKTGPKA